MKTSKGAGEGGGYIHMYEKMPPVYRRQADAAVQRRSYSTFVVLLQRDESYVTHEANKVHERLLLYERRKK